MPPFTSLHSSHFFKSYFLYEYDSNSIIGFRISDKDTFELDSYNLKMKKDRLRAQSDQFLAVWLPHLLEAKPSHKLGT